MIYVDNMNRKFGRMIMCHLASDESVEELQTFADRIGLKREWFQDHRILPHYDVSLTYRKEAVKAGAIEITQREISDVARRFREKDKQLRLL